MPTEVPTLLVKKANKLDQQLRECWSTIKKNRRQFGEIVLQIEKEGLYKFIAKPKSRKGWPSLWEYVEAVTDGEVSRAQMYISMKVAMLAQGPNALPVETVDALSASNAYQLAKLPAEKRTADVVKKAQTQSRNTFVATVQSIKNDALPVEKQRDPKVDFFRRLHPGVAEKLEETIRRFCKLPVIKDGIFDMTLEEKAIYAMCCAAEQNCQEDLRAAEEVERRGSPTIPITETKEAPATEPEILEEVRTADFSAPDFPTVAAAAEAEGRVVPIKRTHLQ